MSSKEEGSLILVDNRCDEALIPVIELRIVTMSIFLFGYVHRSMKGNDGGDSTKISQLTTLFQQSSLFTAANRCKTFFFIDQQIIVCLWNLRLITTWMIWAVTEISLTTR
ncbi:Hypothetical predicted protein [Octopus vulgaris]|uniref:Uncharacterized protein n=1 Tax=Octopus vulgaris TaxID=6645 RepID=A0AA36EW05_OCTVU|nr:Hypothetical predicted protein [Octopus vulgaris]